MQLVEDIILLLGINVYKSGAAFYSNIQTLQKGKYLIVGLNPGGDPNKIKSTIYDSLQKFRDLNYNEYFEKWYESEKEHRLQTNLKRLFKYLGHDLRTVCATNLFYERTKRENELSLSNFPIYRNIFSRLLETVQPEVIFAFGRKPFKTILEFYQASIIAYRSEISGHGKWKIEMITVKFEERVVKIIGLPHLSIYTLYTRDDKLQMIKKFVLENSLS